MMRSRIKESEVHSKRTFQIYQLEKKNSIQLFKGLENSRIEEKQDKTEMELNHLLKIEMQMIEQQSKSRSIA